MAEPETKLQSAYLAALKARKTTPKTTTLPVGEVDSTELNSVLRALDDAQNDQEN